MRSIPQLLAAALFLSACGGKLGSDADGDGWPEAIDCDDNDGAINPGAAEACNGLDDDCNLVADDDYAADAAQFFRDLDGDGFAGEQVSIIACQAPDEGYFETADDCDDLESGVFPGAVESCDGVDEDCDGSIDEDFGDGVTWYADADGDGFGDDFDSVVQCAPPEGYVEYSGDCADDDATRHPTAIETCNDLDDDCDGFGDEDAIDGFSWYADLDGDGFAGIAVVVRACAPPGVDWSLNADDCNDLRSDVYPGGNEICDGQDQDCNGTVDDVAGSQIITVYADGDGDGWGLGADTEEIGACDELSGYAVLPGDCDDLDPGIHPENAEICDARDQDCNGVVDDNPVDSVLYYRDQDGDSFGNPVDFTFACLGAEGYAENADDCDDLNATINPDGVEVCDGRDQDCDGTADDGASDAHAYYADDDGDGFGAGTVVTNACAPAFGQASNADDCDDTAARVHPGADETCDSVDEDCDGTVDNDAIDAVTFYRDLDGDSVGGTLANAQACSAPAGYTADALDCDDLEASVFPGATEVCDGRDQDCDGAIDDDAADATDFYADADLDGIGGSTIIETACSPIIGVATWTDCDDDDVTAFPGADEWCDGADNDCDGLADEADAQDRTVWFADADGDTFGAASMFQIACDAPNGYVGNGDDCDDAAATAYPGATEVCDSANADEDCNGLADDNDPNATGGGDFYPDADLDGYGDENLPNTVRCDALPGLTADNTDCDDTTALVNPGIVGDGTATETDLLDNDCDGGCDEDYLAVNMDVLVIEEIRYLADYNAVEPPGQQELRPDADSNWDYFEVLNRGDQDIRLCEGFLITSKRNNNAQNESVAVSSQEVIPAGGVFVFASTDEQLYNGGLADWQVGYSFDGAIQIEGPSYYGDTTYDTIGLAYETRSNEFDHVIWAANWLYNYTGPYNYEGPLPVSQGYGIQLDANYADATSNDENYNWCERYPSPGWLDYGCGSSGS